MLFLVQITYMFLRRHFIATPLPGQICFHLGRPNSLHHHSRPLACDNTHSKNALIAVKKAPSLRSQEANDWNIGILC